MNNASLPRNFNKDFKISQVSKALMSKGTFVFYFSRIN